MKNVFRALRYFRPDVPRLGLVFLLMAASIALNVLKPWPLALIVDSVLTREKPLPEWLGRLQGWDAAALITVFSLAVLALHLGQGVLSAAQNFISIRIGLRGLRRVRNEVFERLQRLSLRFFNSADSGDLIYRASWDTYSFQTLFQQGLITFTTAALSLALMVIVMWQLNVKLTLVALAIVPLVMLSIKSFGARMRERTADAQQADSKVTSLVQQGITLMQLTQSYTREDVERRHFGEQTRAAEDRRVSQHAWELVYWFAIAMAFGIGAAAITWFGANEILAERLSIGELFVFLGYLAQLYEPLSQLSHVGASVSSAGAGVRRVFEVLDTPEELADGKRPVRGRTSVSAASQQDALHVKGCIEFQSVSFGYEPGREVLHDVGFRIEAGESVAIVGPSGVGKTTLLNLIPRFFDPTGGAIRLDGADLRELRLKDLRAEIALVLQEPVIVPGTVAENIAYGKPGAGAQEIEAAAASANADAFIRALPEGYRTVIGEGGVKLSVGERQRISLARAFLKDAPVLLLDEPTSALDADAERLIVESLGKLIQGRTTLIVAHRPSTIRQVNKVLVLEDGRLTGTGAPGNIVERNLYYSRLVSRDEL